MKKSGVPADRRCCVTRKPKTPISDIKAHPELTRAIMHCDIGRSSLNCEIAPPAGSTSLEWATYNLLCAVGEIAAAMRKAEKRGSAQ